MEIRPFSVAVHASSVAHRAPVRSFLGAPRVLAAAVAGSAVMGVGAQIITVETRPPDLGLHPNHVEMPVFEGIIFGVSVGAVYVVARTLGDIL